MGYLLCKRCFYKQPLFYRGSLWFSEQSNTVTCKIQGIAIKNGVAESDRLFDLAVEEEERLKRFWSDYYDLTYGRELAPSWFSLILDTIAEVLGISTTAGDVGTAATAGAWVICGDLAENMATQYIGDLKYESVERSLRAKDLEEYKKLLIEELKQVKDRIEEYRRELRHAPRHPTEYIPKPPTEYRTRP